MKSARVLKNGLQKRAGVATLAAKCFSSLAQQDYIAMEKAHGCNNYAPLPVVLERAEGVFMWDTDGNKYFDYLAGYSAVNQGHCHPKLVEAMTEQAKKLTLTSRAFHNNKFGPALKYLTQEFGYDKVLFMNSGSEAGESAVKFARRWAYEKKGVPADSAQVLFAKGNFWGRTIAACGSSDDPDRYHNFGPYHGLGFHLIDYNNIEEVEKAFEAIPNLAAFMFEPIQGEAGVVVPDTGYLQKVRELCDKHNVLMICDEVQSGLGRTGKKLAVEWEGVRPDIITLGKALSGGFYPISAVLCDDHIMENIRPGDHGSTFGGNPLAAALAPVALDILKNDNCYERSVEQGEKFRNTLGGLNLPLIHLVRGRGLMNAVVIDESGDRNAWNLCLNLKSKGVLAKPTHGNIIRFTPPLIMTDDQFDESLDRIISTFKEF